jgi:hypothetical protein
MRTLTADPIGYPRGSALIDEPNVKLPGNDLVPQGTSSPRRDEVVSIFESRMKVLKQRGAPRPNEPV